MPARVEMPASFRTLVDSWMLQLRAEGKSPATLTNYGSSVRLFAAWLDALPDHGFPPRVTDWGAVSRDHSRAWLAHLVDSGVAQDTRRARHCGADRFFTAASSFTGRRTWRRRLARYICSEGTGSCPGSDEARRMCRHLFDGGARGR